MQKMVKLGISRALRYVYPPNKLGRCGDSLKLEEYKLLLTDPWKGREFLDTLQNFSKYCGLISERNHLEKYHSDVIDTYFIGTPLAYFDGNSYTHLALRLKNYGAIIKKSPGINNEGEIALKLINSCAVRYGIICEKPGKYVKAECARFEIESDKIILRPAREIIYLLPFENLTYSVGDLVTIHWNYVIEKVNLEMVEILRKNIEEELSRFNESKTRN